jgi:hypothetical protein
MAGYGKGRGGLGGQAWVRASSDAGESFSGAVEEAVGY